MRRVCFPLLLLVAGCTSGSDEPPAPLPPSGPRAGLFISPMGEPFRVRESPDLDLIGRWFAGADANGDGAITEAEMQRDATRFFKTLDTDGDGEITPPEMIRYEQQVAPEIQLGSQMPRGRGSGGRPGQGGRGFELRREGGAEGRRRGPQEPRLPQGASRYALLDLPQPVAAADADFNRAVAAEEFEGAAADRFRQLDRDRDGRLTLAELKPAPPPEPKKGRRKR